MSDPWLNIDKALLNHDFLTKAQALLITASAHGCVFRVYFGFRSLDRQAKLYAKYLAGGPRAAPPGKSPHNFGKGIDVVRIIDDKQTWLPMEYDILAELAPRYDLETGAAYHDYGHIQPLGWHWQQEKP